MVGAKINFIYLIIVYTIPLGTLDCYLYKQYYHGFELHTDSIIITK